uniref:Phosphatidylinositol-4-phosphate 5-kinase like 1 n=1 Tax=Seriola lalandi dorsalis TaxID=1841481 RepID=A0A3B4YLR0_SERLL
METSAAAGGVGRMSGNHQRSVKRRRWGGLRQQWKLLGLFEIDQQHEFYGLTCMMKEGLAAAVQSTIDNAPTVSTNQLRLEVTQIHKDFAMETFAGPVFASLRGSLGVTEQEYQKSLCSENCYLQFISNSKSKADFFLTNDKRFFLKTQNKREIKFLLSNLKIYMEHLKKYPHSLLNLVCSSCPLQKYFIVMQSVFYPDDRINARYDIKGCEVSRWTEPSPEGSQIIVVLKDLNFEGQYITLGKEQRPWLLRQVEIDTHFLRRLNVLDYSLLLAHQPLQNDERHQSLSFHAGPGNDATELSDFRAQNRRLLPNLKNPLHIIDGPEQRYFIGIIDIFTVYSFKKRLEHLWKRLRHPGRSFSTVSPQTYCLRLCQWVQDHTK